MTGKKLWTAEFADQENHQRRLCRVAFSPDGKQVATASGLTIYLFDAHTGRNGRLIKARSKPVQTDSTGLNFITLLAFADDGKTLYSWACGDRVRAWDLQTGRNRLAVDGHQGAVVSVAFSADGKRVISTAEDDHLRLWEAGTGKEIALSQPALASDGYLLVLPGGENKPPVLVDAMGKHHARLEKEVQHWVLSPDGKFLIGWNGNPANEVKVWRADGDWQSGQVVVAGITAYRPPGPAAFSLNLPLLALVEDSGRVQIRRLTGTLAHVRTLDAGQGHRCIHAALSPDGRLAAGIVGSDTIAVWETDTGREVRRFQTGLAGDPRCLAFSPDNRTLVAGGEHTGVRLWEVASGQLRCQWQGHQDFVTAVGFSPDGRRIVSGSQDWTMLTWDVASPPGKLALRNVEDGWQALSGPDAESATGPCASWFVTRGHWRSCASRLGRASRWEGRRWRA